MKLKLVKKIAPLLMICMLFSVLPATAFAANDFNTEKQSQAEDVQDTMSALAAEGICQIIDTDGTSIVGAYDDFADALSSVENGQTIRLLENIDYNSGMLITGKSITIDVNGKILNITNGSGHGLEVGAGGEVKLTGRDGGGKFNVKGGGSGGRHGVYAHNGGKAEVTNATTSSSGTDCRGAYTTGAGSEITVYGNVTFGGFYGIGASAGGIITVYGNVEGGGGMYVTGEGTKVTIYGYSNGGGTGIFALDKATVYVKGNVYGGGIGVYANTGAQITIDGYVRAYTGGQIYIQLGGNINKMQADYEPVSSKDGYFEYNDGVSNVWVKKFDPPLAIAVTYIYEGQTEYTDQNATGTEAAMLTKGTYYSTLASAPDPDPTYEEYIFDGWYTEPDGKGTEWIFGDADTGTALIDKNGVDITTRILTLYAYWTETETVEEIPPQTDQQNEEKTPSQTDQQKEDRITHQTTTYTVAYEPGSHGTFKPQVTNNLPAGAETPTAPKPTGKAGYKFAGWSTKIKATVTENTTYVAEWEKTGTEAQTGDRNNMALWALLCCISLAAMIIAGRTKIMHKTEK